MTNSELIEFVKFEAELKLEMARKLASWKSGNNATPTAVPQQTQSAAPNGNYITGTIKNIFGHKASNGSGNYVNTVVVELENGKEAIFNVTFNRKCRTANWNNFYDPLNVPHVDKDSTIKQQEAVNLDSLIEKEVKVKMVNGKIEKFVKDKEKIPGLEKQINELFWDSEIRD